MNSAVYTHITKQQKTMEIVQSHQKHDIALILSVLATIATGIDIRVLIDHDDLSVSGIVNGKTVKLKLHFSSPNIKYYMIGSEKGIIYADAFVDEGRAFGHITVPRFGYPRIIAQIQGLEERSEKAAHQRGSDAYDFLKLDDVTVED